MFMFKGEEEGAKEPKLISHLRQLDWAASKGVPKGHRVKPAVEHTPLFRPV
jgi:hypothetical protein